MLHEQQELLLKLEEELKQHNWYWEYQEPYGAYVKGRDSARRIRRMLNKAEELGIGEKARAIYNKHKPKDKPTLS